MPTCHDIAWAAAIIRRLCQIRMFFNLKQVLGHWPAKDGPPCLLLSTLTLPASSCFPRAFPRNASMPPRPGAEKIRLTESVPVFLGCTELR